MLVRASQKDLFYLGQLTDQLQEVLRGIFGEYCCPISTAKMSNGVVLLLGTRWLQAYIEEIGVASGLAYYGLTTLLGKLIHLEQRSAYFVNFGSFVYRQSNAWGRVR